jgi:hypothetical protein
MTGEEMMKDVACAWISRALERDRLRRYTLEIGGYSIWHHLRLLWKSVRNQWTALRCIWYVHAFDPEWAGRARRKFLEDMKRPLDRLPDGSVRIGDGLFIRVDDIKESRPCKAD